MIPSLETRLQALYPKTADEVARAIRALVREYSLANAGGSSSEEGWSERDVVLITYADQLSAAGATPLATLRDWLVSTELDELLSVVHLLPFCPHSSDDGFSVVDYLAVDPAAGDWPDIARLGESVDLMFDLVLNHISRQSEWFQQYLAGESPFDRFFVEVDPTLDLSTVVRPRSLPLLTPVKTSRGLRHVWTTFSDDQIDLDYTEPDVLLRMLRVLLEYARRGARIIRLDAIAFLWKQIGTPCLHLPQTHEVVRLMRDIVTEAFPRTLLLTETNVPHDENVSYFGNGDEAHMVYQFSLPPLLLDAFVNGDAVYLREWLASLAPPPSGCTFFNFTASHDGIGVRPLEGLVPDERLDRVVASVRARGGLIGMRRRADGGEAPYELNITFVDALSPTTPDEPLNVELHARRFLASQAVMLALPGMPAVYFHSLVGSQNDREAVEATGINRRINRHRYTLPELQRHLADQDSLGARIYQGYRQLLAVRKQHRAFHPDAPMRLLDAGSDQILAFQRTSLDGSQRLTMLVNFGPDQVVAASQIEGCSGATWCDLCAAGREPLNVDQLLLKAGDWIWLHAE